ncbi:hypothetical protein PG996_009295 [Apiospora saccharicola]|uniref:Uncharacterized protein n=1 Tax=Apiospora saccharicola TaxID=335842 RepID=A0ABR1UKB8_9PEZI
MAAISSSIAPNPANSPSTSPGSTIVGQPTPSPTTVNTPSITSTGNSRHTTTATDARGQLIRGLAPGEKCTADSECLAPNSCHTDTQSTTCCGPGNWGCPGATCGSHNDCLDPFPCHTPAPGSSAICCGYPPWTVYQGASCWSTYPATATKAV